MKNNALQYTFKIWITSVMVSPFLFVLILLIRQQTTLAELMDDGWRLPGMYLFLAVLQLLFSFFTWIVFLFLVKIVSLIPLPNLLIKLIIFCIGILLTICTFMAINNTLGEIDNNNSFINIVYANCIGIGWGVWYYKLDIKARDI